MRRKDLTKTMMISKSQPFGLHVLYKNISATATHNLVCKIIYLGRPTIWLKTYANLANVKLFSPSNLPAQLSSALSMS